MRPRSAAEIAFVAVFYFTYSAIRNASGSDTAAARRNALTLIGWQKSLGINHEQMLQEWALHFKALIIACNYFYGSLHFVVTTAVLVFVYRKFSDDYPLWRNTIAIATGLALIVATANVYYRDVKHLVEVGLQVMFWLTPVVYDLNDVPERFRSAILLSPMSPFISALHDIFYRQAWPHLTIWLAAAGWGLAMFVGGLMIFHTFEDRLAEQL